MYLSSSLNFYRKADNMARRFDGLEILVVRLFCNKLNIGYVGRISESNIDPYMV